MHNVELKFEFQDLPLRARGASADLTCIEIVPSPRVSPFRWKRCAQLVSSVELAISCNDAPKISQSCSQPPTVDVSVPAAEIFLGNTAYSH